MCVILFLDIIKSEMKITQDLKNVSEKAGMITGSMLIGSKAMKDFTTGNWREGLKYGAENLAIQVGIQIAVAGIGAVTFGAGGAAVEGWRKGGRNYKSIRRSDNGS